MVELPEWKSFYKFSYIETENGSESQKIDYKFDSSEFALPEVLAKIEDFLIASGYDWIQRGTLSVKNKRNDLFTSTELGSLPDDLELELADSLKSALEELKRQNNIEIGERMMGIDRTAKVVSINDGKEIPEFNMDTSFQHITPETLNVRWDEYDQTITYGGIPIEEIDFSKHEYEVDEEDNILH